MADTISVSMGIPRNAPLRYGDSVAILPDGVNGLISYGGAHDGRPWVEILCDGAPVRAFNLQQAPSDTPTGRRNAMAGSSLEIVRMSTWDNRAGPVPVCALTLLLFMTELEFFEQVPPNMRDCHFRIKPRSHYGEARSPI